MKSVLVFLAFVLAFTSLAMVCSCGGDDDDNDDSGDDDMGDDDSGDYDCGSTDLLPGIWSAEFVTLEIGEDSSYHAYGTTDSGYDVTGTLTVNGCQIAFTDLEGDNPCPESQVGTYSFVVTTETLVTTAVDDACAGRSVGMDGTEFDRQP